MANTGEIGNEIRCRALRVVGVLSILWNLFCNPGCGHRAGGAGPAPGEDAVLALTGPDQSRPYRRSLRRLLQVLLRRLAEEQSHPRRSGRMERLREARGREYAISLGHSPGGR